MTDWIRCPKCGTVLINFLGFICPSCGYRVPEQTITTLEGVYIENEPPKPNKNYVEVIRCKDCKHWETGHDGFPDLEGKEDHECSKGHGITAGVFFCGSGEQK